MTKEERLDWLCRLRSDIFYLDFSGDKDRKMKYKQVLSETIDDLEEELNKGEITE